MRQLSTIAITPAGRVRRLARFCAWGNHWMSPDDEALHNAGAPTTHGMCDDCAAPVIALLNAEPAMPTPPSAA